MPKIKGDMTPAGVTAIVLLIVFLISVLIILLLSVFGFPGSTSNPRATYFRPGVPLPQSSKPKIIMTYSKHPPAHVLKMLKTFAPEFDLEFFDDTAGRRFLQTYFVDAVGKKFDLFLRRNQKAHAADLLRFCALTVFRGRNLYLDVKTVLKVPIREWFPLEGPSVTAVRTVGKATVKKAENKQGGEACGEGAIDEAPNAEAPNGEAQNGERNRNGEAQNGERNRNGEEKVRNRDQNRNGENIFSKIALTHIGIIGGPSEWHGWPQMIDRIMRTPIWMSRINYLTHCMQFYTRVADHQVVWLREACAKKNCDDTSVDWRGLCCVIQDGDHVVMHTRDPKYPY